MLGWHRRRLPWSIDGHENRRAGTAPTRLITIGVSTSPICGVREYGRVLEDALRRQGVAVRSMWWERNEAWSAARALGAFRTWMDQVAAAVGHDRPDWIVCHYSVFSYCHRGMPTLVPTMARRLKDLGVPVVPVLHEMAAPWQGRGWRGAVVALSHRAALRGLLGVTTGAVVTTEDRLSWLRSRPYLPGRPALCQPVFSCLPLAPGDRAEPPAGGEEASLGSFGWAEGGVRIDPVVRALAMLRHRGLKAHLTLIGAPGPDSPRGRAWQAAVARAGCSDALHFTGVLEPGALALELARPTVLVVADESGPSSRRTTLAAALVAARPVVALDGPQSWRQAVDAGAILVADGAGSMAELIEDLVHDGRRRQAQGAAALGFYRSTAAPEVASSRLVGFLQGLEPRVPASGAGAGWSFLAGLSRALPGVRGRGRAALALHGWMAPHLGAGPPRMWEVPMRRGHCMSVPWSTDQAWLAAFTGGYDEAEIDLLVGRAERGTFFMDVGASLGFWTVPLAEAARQLGSRVLAVEPVASNRAVLSENIRRNGLAGSVDLLPVALGACPGRAVAAVDRGGVGNAALDPPSWAGGGRPPGAAAESVPVVALDDLELPRACRDLRCSVVKVDVEGWEMAVLEGAAAFVARHRPVILGEFSIPWMRMRGIPQEAPQRWAEDAGYRCHEVVLERRRRLSDRASIALVPRRDGEGRGPGPLLLTPHRQDGALSFLESAQALRAGPQRAQSATSTHHGQRGAPPP